MSGASELRAFAAQVKHAAADITPAAEKVIAKGAHNIRQDLQAQLRASTHFKGVAGSITYDLDGLSAEIGPDKASGSGGALANIAYFGGAGWGGRHSGGTVEDPEEALNREAPHVEKWLAEEAVKSFD